MARSINHAPSDKKEVLNLLAKAGRIALIVGGGLRVLALWGSMFHP